MEQRYSLFVIKSPVGRLREHGRQTAIDALNEETAYWVDYGCKGASADVFTYYMVVRDATGCKPSISTEFLQCTKIKSHTYDLFSPQWLSYQRRLLSH